jgi:hypothetical protein
MALDIAAAHRQEARRSKFSIATFFGPWSDVPAQRRDCSS